MGFDLAHIHRQLAACVASALLLSLGSGCNIGSDGSDGSRAGGEGENEDSDGGGGRDGAARADGGGRSDGSVAIDAGPPTCDGGACNVSPSGLFRTDFTTTWNPGVSADTPTGHALGADGLPVRDGVCASVPAQTGNATSAIQKALDGCKGKHQVVSLAAGKYTVSSTIVVPSGVVLRGVGSEAGGTTIVNSSGGPVVSIGTQADGVCYQGSGFVKTSQPLLTKDAVKETTTVEVASAAGFAAGDLALIDQTDSSEVSAGDCGGSFKRTEGYGVSERVEIASVSGTTLTLSSPLHWTFTTAQKAQISKASGTPTKWAGVEKLRVQGGRPGGYPGEHAGGIEVSNAAYSWVKDVEVDGTTSGMPMRLAGTYRCVVRDSHFHNSYSYGFAQDNYGIVIACGAADNLVENNIARFMNKPILFNTSGGGNVVGYNYADNSWSCDGNDDDGFQEVSIDCHCAFPHMELMEGNWAPHMGATITHGNAGYLTYFRNYASSQWSPSKSDQSSSAIVWSQPFKPQYANVGALQLDDPDVKMTVVGNVLGSTADAALGVPLDLKTTDSTSKVYASTEDGPAIFIANQSAVAWTTLWLHGNFDTVNRKVMWNASALTKNLPASTQTLPASLYHAQRPGWWPAGTPWPWVGPELNPKVGKLPAHERSMAFDYYTGDDATCTLNCGAYCCRVGDSCTL